MRLPGCTFCVPEFAQQFRVGQVVRIKCGGAGMKYYYRIGIISRLTDSWCDAKDRFGSYPNIYIPSRICSALAASKPNGKNA